MKIAFFGSTGFLGKVLLGHVLDAEHQVRVLVRNPEKLGELKEKVEIVEGEYFDAEKVDETVRGVDAVVSCIGPPIRKSPPVDQYATAMENLIAAMKRNGIKRFVWTGGAATTLENEKLGFKQKFIKLMIDLMAGHTLPIKRKEYAIIAASDIEWIAIRPPRIASGTPKGIVLADESTLASSAVNIHDLSAFMLEQLVSDEWVRKAPLVAS